MASQVTGLQTEIKNIRASIQTDITTAVAGVSTALSTAQGELKDEIGTEVGRVSDALSKAQGELKGEIGTEVGRVSEALSKAQTALNTEIGKLQKALEEAAANSLSQDDIDKLETDLRKAQRDALDTALAGLQTKLNELEQALAAASTGSLSQKDLDQLKADIQAQLAQVKEELEASLGDGGFHSGSVEITSSGGWEATKRQLGNKTEFNGDFTINTEKLSATEVDELIGWVAKITLIYGDLTITHKDKDQVLKFGQLTSITDLNDDQPHVHYPALTSAGIISLDGGDILTVQLPKLTTLTQFAGHEIDLRKGTALTLSALSAYTDDLSIDLGGTSAEIDVQALESVAKGSTGKLLTVIGPDEVALPALTTLEKLHIKEVRTLTAPKVKGADLEISEDVDHVEVGTADGAHINVLTLSDAADLKTLQIGGNPSTKASDGTVVVLNEDHTPKLEKAHIHGGRSLTVSDLEDLQEIITARSINTVAITGTGIEDELILGHDSGTNGILTIEHNTDIESLVADKVNKLKGLYIKGNHDLAKVSFKAFKVPGSQHLGTGAQWFTGDGFVIGKAGYGDYNDGQSAQDNKNDLIATEITQEILKADESVDRAGKIVDGTGLSDLAEVLQHANTKRAVISFDGTEAFKGQNRSAAAVEVATTQANHEDLILFRKGVANRVIPGTKAKRVFSVRLSSGNAGTITIGIRGGVSKSIALTPGGSVKNWVNDLNAKEVKDFFKVNEITVESRVGSEPKSHLQFNLSGTINHTQGDNNITNDLGGSFKLTIGEYSHEVILSDGTEADKPFSATNKKAITYVDADDSSEFMTPTQLLGILDDPFHYYSSYPSSPDNQKGLDSDGNPLVPIGMNEPSFEGYITYGLHDRQPIDKPITVTWENKLDQDGLFNILDESNKDIENEPYLLVILTSDVPGAGDKSTIGHPQEGFGRSRLIHPRPLSDDNENNGEAYVEHSRVVTVELTIGEDLVIKSTLPKKGIDQDKTTNRGDDDLSRVDWLE